MDEKPQQVSWYDHSRAWLSDVIPAPNIHSSSRRLVIASIIIFAAAFGVRLIHWQDYQFRIGSDLSSLVSRYQQQAQRMLDGEGILYPVGYKEHASVQLIVHPPGYSVFIACIYRLFGKSDNNVILAKTICDSFAAVMVSLIVAQLFPFAASVIAGFLVAFSPQLAHHSIMLLPESLTALPILVAIWLILRTIRKPRLISIVSAGALIGVSCWLRSNGLLLAIFLAAMILFLFEPGRRLRYATLFIVGTICVISPITIRNWIVFGHFIPISLGAGLNLVEGIGDYDDEKRFGMPTTDNETARKDAEWHNRPDYAMVLWRPDGIARDRYRSSRGLDVVRKNPLWFAGVMLRRAGSMLRYNDSLYQGWPADTAKAPVVSPEPSFGHQLVTSTEPVWSNSAAELFENRRVISPRTAFTLADDRRSMTVVGDKSDFDDQFCSAPIPVAENTDYILKADIQLIDGLGAAKITSADQRIALASHILKPTKPAPSEPAGSTIKDDVDIDSGSGTRASNATAESQATASVLMPFATGRRSEVVLVISNNGPSLAASKIELAGAQLFELGPTPYQWSRVVRRAVRAIQRDVYKTFRLLPLIGLGIVLLAAARRWRALLVLLVVPAYYLLVHSTLHTEYRYILAMHYFLLSIAAVTLWLIGILLNHASRPAIRRLKAWALRDRL